MEMEDSMTLDILLENLLATGCPVQQNEPMRLHTTFKIGGPADLFASPKDQAQLGEILALCREAQVPVTVIGKGSNLLVSDEGIRGVVVHMDGGFGGLTLAGPHTIRCGAGISLAKLCLFALENGLSGLEFAWGIPGSAGGAAYMNAGAYGGEMKQVLTRCTHITPDGRLGAFSGENLKLSYRRSAYTDSDYVITSLELTLTPGNKDQIRAKMDDYLSRRKEKQPLEYPSAGSVFKRPPGYFAGGLIEQCGLKGYRIGDAMVSEKHAGFIINVGQASCRDVLQLIAHIQRTVLQECGVPLECEVKHIGLKE